MASEMSVSVRPDRMRDALWFAAFLAAYYLAYRYGMAFSRVSASPFWFPDSVLLCALLKSRPRYWWIFILAILPIRLFSEVARDVPQNLLFETFAIDALKAVAGALVMRRLLADPVRFATVREFLLFGLVVAVAIPALSAFAGAAARNALGFSYWITWKQWFLGDVLAQLIITPAIFYWVFDIPRRGWTLSPQRTAEAGLLFVALLVSGYLAATTPASSTYFMDANFIAAGAVAVVAAIRFGMPGVTGALAIVGSFVIGAAIDGRGPFAGHSPDDTALALQGYLLLRAVPLYLIAISIDQRTAAEQSLRESEERFRLMAHSAPILLWTAGPDGITNFVNQSWLDFTGRRLDQELGNGWLEGMHPDDVNRCTAAFAESVESRKAFQTEYRLRRHDGTYRWILDTGVPRYTPDGAFAGHIGSAIDITDRKHIEETNRALAHSQRLASIGELTAAIAHELRQPMSAVLLEAQTAERLTAIPDPSLPELREIAVSIRDNVKRIDTVITRIRAFVRRQETPMEATDVNVVVLNVLWLVHGEALRRNIQLRTELDPGLPLVRGDRTQLEQVLLNLVLNGMEAMEGVTRSAGSLTLRTLALGHDSVEVIVHDCGRGIAPDQMPLLFDSFFTTRKEGMGLGLSIAKSIVVAHNGHIWAENNAQGGATFHFTVPVANSETRALTG